MTYEEAMAKLESLGWEQTRRTWRRHGAKDPMFGVKFGDLYEVVKAIGTDHGLARELWASRNADARLLATMIADPAALTSSEVDAMVKDVENGGLAGALGGLVARSPLAARQVAKWTAKKDEYVAATGWQAVAALAMADGGPLDEAAYRALIDDIEARIASSANRARYGMNTALIAIGTRSDALAKSATAAAKRIGKVEVDHGDTACKTTEAVAGIAKARAHRKAKEERRKAKR